MSSPVLLFKACVLLKRKACVSLKRIVCDRIRVGQPARSCVNSALGAEDPVLELAGNPHSPAEHSVFRAKGICHVKEVFAPGELLTVPRELPEELPKELKSGPAGPNTSRTAPVAMVLSRSQLEQSLVAVGALEDKEASEAGHGLLVSFLLRTIQMRGTLV